MGACCTTHMLFIKIFVSVFSHPPAIFLRSDVCKRDAGVDLKAVHGDRTINYVSFAISR